VGERHAVQRALRLAAGARAVTGPMTRLAAADIALAMEVEPATFVAVQRKDAGL